MRRDFFVTVLLHLKFRCQERPWIRVLNLAFARFHATPCHHPSTASFGRVINQRIASPHTATNSYRSVLSISPKSLIVAPSDRGCAPVGITPWRFVKRWLFTACDKYKTGNHFNDVNHFIRAAFTSFCLPSLPFTALTDHFLHLSWHAWQRLLRPTSVLHWASHHPFWRMLCPDVTHQWSTSYSMAVQYPLRFFYNKPLLFMDLW